ncbi:NAD-dependent epimerase/dehydratase family protein [Streptomyces sp. NPDC005355]|uniref:NAD-dependent epimerase/dehydratase family protein n=1 Tax=Streptomyces sp. NPDC005355 TaxID=3157038 RepID=UPI0033BA9F96
MSRVLMIGATGYLGSAIAAELARRGHTVLGLAASDAATAALDAAGYETLAGGLADVELLALHGTDGVVYAAGAPTPQWPETERTAISALLGALSGTGGPLLYTSGSLMHGPTDGRAATEDSPLAPPAALAFKAAIERQVRSAPGVRGVVIRPSSCYGNGGGGPARLLELTRRTGAAVHTGDGAARHSFVHVEDLARLYALAFEGAEHGSVYLAEDGHPVTTRRLAEALAAAAGVGGQVRQITEEQAERIFGPLAPTLAMESVVSSAKARRELGWIPRQTDVVTDLTAGSYRNTAA